MSRNTITHLAESFKAYAMSLMYSQYKTPELMDRMFATHDAYVYEYIQSAGDPDIITPIDVHMDERIRLIDELKKYYDMKINYDAVNQYTINNISTINFEYYCILNYNPNTPDTFPSEAAMIVYNLVHITAQLTNLDKTL